MVRDLNYEKRPADPALATLLTTPDPPTREEYAAKKVIIFLTFFHTDIGNAFSSRNENQTR